MNGSQRLVADAPLERGLAWVSLASGAILAVGETAHGMLYGGTLAGLAIDYIAAALLLYAGFRSLASGGGAGLLFGAWAYALCDAYRAVWWRAQVASGSLRIDEPREPFAVLVVLIVAAALTVVGFGISFYLAHPPGSRRR